MASYQEEEQIRQWHRGLKAAQQERVTRNRQRWERLQETTMGPTSKKDLLTEEERFQESMKFLAKHAPKKNPS